MVRCRRVMSWGELDASTRRLNAAYSSAIEGRRATRTYFLIEKFSDDFNSFLTVWLDCWRFRIGSSNSTSSLSSIPPTKSTCTLSYDIVLVTSISILSVKGFHAFVEMAVNGIVLQLALLPLTTSNDNVNAKGKVHDIGSHRLVQSEWCILGGSTPTGSTIWSPNVYRH